MNLYFDGYCPESMLKGERIEMRLNEDDFWESEATGLQIAVFPPYAAILRWRGQGKFRSSSDIASNLLVGLLLTGAVEKGRGFIPDENNVLYNKSDLEKYLRTVHDTKKEYKAKRVDPESAIFRKQKQYLENLPLEQLMELVQLYNKSKSEYDGELMDSVSFNRLYHLLYDLDIIFNFDWAAWHKGKWNVVDEDLDCREASLLELAMYLTVIFRIDRFAEGYLNRTYRNGRLDKIFKRLEDIITIPMR